MIWIIEFAHVPQCLCHWCFPVTISKCVPVTAAYVSLPKKGMDFQIQRDHYHKVYIICCYSFWSAESDRRCSALTHCLPWISGYQFPRRWPAVEVMTATTFCFWDCTRDCPVFEVLARTVRWYSSLVMYQITKVSADRLSQAAQKSLPFWPVDPCIRIRAWKISW